MNSLVHDLQPQKNRPKGIKRKALRTLLRANPHVNPYADGWYVIAFSRKVRTDRLLSKKFMGEEVVIYRDVKSGEVVVVQAHCPHMGAHFDSYENGGCVKDGVITCPYHALRYDASGTCLDASSQRAHLKKYKTLEHNGFVLALYQRNISAEPISIELEFPGVDPSEYVRANQTLGVFHGDAVVPLMANADYFHFHSVHGRNLMRSDHQFSVSEDKRECYFSFEIDDTVSGQGDAEYPRTGYLKKFRKMLARPSGGMTEVTSIGRGPGVVVSRWVQTAFSTDLITWLYVTPISPYEFEVYLCHGAKTLKRFKSPLLQKAINWFSANAFMLAMYLFVSQEDPPFYSNLKLRLDKPAFNKNDKLLVQYLAWWRQLFGPEYVEMIAGWDIDFI